MPAGYESAKRRGLPRTRGQQPRLCGSERRVQRQTISSLAVPARRRAGTSGPGSPSRVWMRSVLGLPRHFAPQVVDVEAVGGDASLKFARHEIRGDRDVGCEAGGGREDDCDERGGCEPEQPRA